MKKGFNHLYYLSAEKWLKNENMLFLFPEMNLEGQRLNI